MLPLPGATRFPTRDELGLARPAWPDPADARRVAQWLIKADNPAISAGRSGRNPESVEELVRLAELLALPDLPVDVALRDLGGHLLKDLARPEHIYQLVIGGLAAEFPPLATVDAIPDNLPGHETNGKSLIPPAPHFLRICDN